MKANQTKLNRNIAVTHIYPTLAPLNIEITRGRQI
jgi:hypothetical protein